MRNRPRDGASRSRRWKQPGARLAGAAVVLGSLVAPVQAADPAWAQLCRTLLHEEEVERDDLAREVDLARVRAAAAGEVFVMLQGLWDNDAVPRIVYLRSRYDRDILAARERRDRSLLRRQEELLEQLRGLCAAPAASESAGRKRIDAAYARYLEAECEGRALEVEIARLELEFRRELLAGLLDLEKSDVASKSDVILSRRDVEMAEVDLAQAGRRAESCLPEPASTKVPAPE